VLRFHFRWSRWYRIAQCRLSRIYTCVCISKESRADDRSGILIVKARILALHGGGVTGEVFRLQMRSIIASFKDTFRFVFADGPFFCDAGPGIIPVYADFEPFRRWLRWLPEHREIEDSAAIDEIWWQLNDAMASDDRLGATGEWVGLLGFSQGAKMSASLLYEQQARQKLAEKGPLSEDDKKKPNWKFAILLAGRAPLVSLRPDTDSVTGLVRAGQISEGFETLEVEDDSHVLKIPTVHVHGLLDKGLHLHRRLLNQYCDPSTTTVVEWNGEHRVPIKSADVKMVSDAMIAVAKKTGVL
jgi:predicted esterase